MNTRQEAIVDGVIGANTTMLQLAAKMNSASIGRSPFTFNICGGTPYPAAFFGLNRNKAAKISLPPILHAYVGTDISAGLLVCPDFFDNDKAVLFIDMGTNGKICLNVKQGKALCHLNRCRTGCEDLDKIYVTGSIALLINKDRRTFLESALKKMTYLQLAESKAFMGCFLKNLDFSPEF